MAVRHYFLGANTARGFYSLYHEFCAPDSGNFLWVLKGGPGCGKSTFMRQIGAAAEEAGLDVEYALCSADVDSLDGVFVPAWHVGYVDGTAPHALEPSFPAASGAYLDLGQFYDVAALRPLLLQMQTLTAQYRALYAQAYDALREAKALHDELERLYNPHVDFDGVNLLAKAHIKMLKEEKIHCIRAENVVK